MEYFAHSQKEFVYKYVVMLSDTDYFKHMSFTNYLKLMFLATDALMLSSFQKSLEANQQLRLIDSRMQFKKQTVFGDNILIKVNSTKVEGCRFSLLHTFLDEKNASLIALGRQSYEAATPSGNLQELPLHIRQIIEPIAVEEEHLLYKY